jgi:hypothetical protein
MSDKLKTYVIRGKAKWFRAVGKPVGGYPNGTGPEEWSFDLIPDNDSKEKLLKLGMSKKYLKTNQDGEEYVKFSRKAKRRDGTDSQPFRIVDHNNLDWDDRLVGNGSTLNVQIVLNEIGTGKDKRLKPSALAIQVWDLEKYVTKPAFESKGTPESASEEWA